MVTLGLIINLILTKKREPALTNIAGSLYINYKFNHLLLNNFCSWHLWWDTICHNG